MLTQCDENATKVYTVSLNFRVGTLVQCNGLGFETTSAHLVLFFCRSYILMLYRIWVYFSIPFLQNTGLL